MKLINQKTALQNKEYFNSVKLFYFTRKKYLRFYKGQNVVMSGCKLMDWEIKFNL